MTSLAQSNFCACNIDALIRVSFTCLLGLRCHTKNRLTLENVDMMVIRDVLFGWNLQMVQYKHERVSHSGRNGTGNGKFAIDTDDWKTRNGSLQGQMLEPENQLN